jgi:uncharacterized protein (TIGR03083 family)
VELAVTKQEIVQAIRTERARTLAMLHTLEPAQWEIEALPRWRIREVAAHLITTDRASVTGAIFPKIVSSTSEKLERWNDRAVGAYADRPIDELLVALDRWGRRVAGVVKVAPTAAFRVRVPTMWGKGPAGMFAWSRPFDEWVHRQDIRRALGMADEQADLAVVAGFVLTAAGTSVLPGLAGRAGSITVDLSGVPLPPWTADLRSGESAFGPRGDAGSGDHSATIRAPAAAFVMTAAARGTFAELEERGELEIDGDRAAADEFLGRLRVV